MKKSLLISLWLLSLTSLADAAPTVSLISHSTATLQSGATVSLSLGRIDNLVTSSITIPSGSTFTIPSPLSMLGQSIVGIGPVLNATATATTGGSLTTGVTYYYKVYPIQANGYVGTPSPEMNVLMSGSNHTTTISWNAVPNAVSYRVSQGTSQGAQGGYLPAVAVSTQDTGQSLTGGNAFTQATVEVLLVNGSVLSPASSGGMDVIDYVTGQRYNMLSITSAGEMQYQPGQNGGNKGVHYFQDSAGAGLFQFDRTGTNNSEMIAWNGASLNNWDMVYGSTIALTPNNIKRFEFHTGDFSPSQDVTEDFGQPTTRWANGYINTLSSTTVKVFLGGTGITQLKGTSNGTDAPAGYQGEYTAVSVLRASAKALTTNVSTSLSTVTLTAGDWDVSFACGFTGSAVTTQLDCATSVTSNTFPASNTLAAPNTSGEAWMEVGASIATVDQTIPSPRVRVSSSGSTTLYLVVRAIFPASAASAYGSISYRRASAH